MKRKKRNGSIPAQKKVRSHYAKHQREQRERFENLFKLNGAGTIHCRLDESYVKKLLGYFKARI